MNVNSECVVLDFHQLGALAIICTELSVNGIFALGFFSGPCFRFLFFNAEQLTNNEKHLKSMCPSYAI